MNKFKKGDKVTVVNGRWAQPLCHGQIYTVAYYHDSGLLHSLELLGVAGTFRADHFTLVKEEYTRTTPVNLKLTLADVIILTTLLKNSSGEWADHVGCITHKALTEYFSVTKIREALQKPSQVIGIHKLHAEFEEAIAVLFAKPKSSQQLEYEKLQEQIKALQIQAEKLNPNGGN